MTSQIKIILLTMIIFLSFGAAAKENVFICNYSNSSGINKVEFTLIINTELKYLRFGDARYDEDFQITDLYIEASMKNDPDFGNGSISFNNVTGELTRKSGGDNWWFYECRKTSKLVS